MRRGDFMLDKSFDAATAEPRLYEAWEASGAFAPARDGDEAFCIVIPPPNVTGSLHIGHALNNTLQDILTRYHRMRGKRVLWQPGTDHAGIATQMVVERQLAERQEPSRRDLGRAAFLKRVWAWKEESGGMILKQLRRLGASCDWSRERFTMDDGLSAAVRKVFVDLYHQGLIYRAQRLVNWDPKFQTAISDLEVENVEVQGKMWHFAYPLQGDPVDGVTEIQIATTRPETMLGDGAVAVHPDDDRYKKLVGRLVRLPLADRLIPIIADDYPDPEKGSGAVKITGAHDFNDFEVAQRHNLPLITIMDEHARMASAEGDPALATVPKAYRGLDRYEARKMVVADIDALGLLRKVEDTTIAQPFGDRSGVVIEPRLTDQWFVDAETLAKPALEAVADGRTKFVPENWVKTYNNWLKDIQPWCISRQLWWGHRIPAWYGPDGEVFVADDAAGAQALAKTHYGRAVELSQDEDVLDTWFTSALWPFSTLGWPDETDELKTFYPTSVLVTGFDIIFFWVARMMMQGLHFMKDVPFREVYITPLVLDEKGQKMSKSKGNTIDPLDVIDGVDLETLVDKRVAAVMQDKDKKRIEKLTRKEYPDGIERYGADAMRFTMAAQAVQGRELRFSIDRVAGYRNFGTKIWNAGNLLQRNGCRVEPGWDPASAQLAINRWIVGGVVRTSRQLIEQLEHYRFADAAAGLYRFAWNVFCDWYLELTKPVFIAAEADRGNDDAQAAARETRACAAWAYDHLLKLLHPFMPFITEELWGQTAPEGGRANMLIVERWPELPAGLIDEEAASDIDGLIRLVTAIRSVRSEMGLPAGAKLPVRVFEAGKPLRDRLKTHNALICRLANLKEIKVGRKQPEAAVQTVVDGARVVLSLKGFVDLDVEKARLAKEIEKVDGEITRLAKKLSNDKFVAKAPDDVVAAERDKQMAYEAQKAKLASALDSLEGVG